MDDRVLGATRRRRPRISDDETTRRTLEAGVAVVSEHGLTVSLEHLSLEEIIRQAGVSRASVYRRWPARHQFFNDLLVEVARGQDLRFDLGPVVAAVEAVLQRHRAPAGVDAAVAADRRHALVVDLLLASIEADFSAVSSSAAYRTYLGVRATFASLPDGPTREAVAQTLAGRERSLISARAALYAALADSFGYRLVPALSPPSGFEVVAHAASAAMNGMLLALAADPGLRERTVGGSSLPAYVVARAILAHLEPDPNARVEPDSWHALPAMLRSIDASTLSLSPTPPP